MIDTLKLSKRLEDAGMNRQQAEAIAAELKDGLEKSAATKTDLEGLEARLTNKLYAVGFSVVLALGILQHVLKP